MIDVPILLSVIVISHNQRDELRRCLDSILAMNLSFPYEIIVSDDRSTDGTFELALTYKQKYVEGNLARFIAVQCNSDEGNCANNSLRSGYNRCNAYPYAQGKYIAHVDADDYFRPGADVYERQVAALEKHPECALAMSTCLTIKEGEPLTNGTPWPFPRKMTDGEIIEQRDFVRGNWFRLNQCFIQRRNPNVNPVKLYGNRYVDSVITYHHLQFGKVVYVDACDYIYVHHPNSVVTDLSKDDKDSIVMWCLGLYIPVLIPKWTQDFYMGFYYQQIREVIKLAKSNYQLKEKNYNGLKELHIWIYDCFARKMNIWDVWRLRLIDFGLKVSKKAKIENSLYINVLKSLLNK